MISPFKEYTGDLYQLRPKGDQFEALFWSPHEPDTPKLLLGLEEPQLVVGLGEARQAGIRCTGRIDRVLKLPDGTPDLAGRLAVVRCSLPETLPPATLLDEGLAALGRHIGDAALHDATLTLTPSHDQVGPIRQRSVPPDALRQTVVYTRP